MHLHGQFEKRDVATDRAGHRKKSTRDRALPMASHPETSSEETEHKLVVLEEEWQVRLSAPMVQLNQLEQALNRAIDRAQASLPLM